MKKTYKLAIVCLSLLLVGSILGATVFASAATASDYVRRIVPTQAVRATH